MTVIQGINFGSITLKNLDTMVLIELNNSMQWTDRYSSQSVAGNLVRTLGGSIVSFRASLSNGRSITLRATNQTGWLPWVQVSQILQWAGITDPSVLFELVFYGETYTVLFAHLDSPAVSFRQLQSRQEETDGWFVGDIKLYTV